MKKTIVTVLVSIILNQIIQAQEVLVKNLQGQDVSMTSILQQSEKDQPTILITWANSYCGVCKTIIDELQNQYAPLKEKYNLRVITLNTDSNKDEMFKKHYNSRYKDDMGAFTSITDFVRNYKGIKNWEFEKYVDEDFNFFESAGLKGAPVTYIFYNNELKFYKYGFWVPKEAKSSDGSAKLQMTTSENTVNNLKRILGSMYANEAYFDANWHYTLEEDKPTYKRTVVKMGNLFEITDSWITGEMQMRGTFKDRMGNIHEGKTAYYYKNGNKQETRNYIDNVKNGASVDYYENGKVNWKGSIKNGKYDGKWEGFYDNGKPIAEKIWNEGKLLKINYFNDADGQILLQNGTGIYKEYYQKKVVKSIQKYREHQKHGEWKYYYENGQLSAIVNYEDDKAHGTFTTYYKNSKVKTKGNYWEGKKDSVWTYYDEEGKETKSELWERGQQVELKEN